MANTPFIITLTILLSINHPASNIYPKAKMIPDFLTDTYKCYKSNTTEALTWLGTTEKARNKGPSVFQQAQQPRLKGKARKIAKEIAQASASEKHILALADIIP